MSPLALGVEFADPVLEQSVRDGLDAVETSLRAAVRSDDEFVAIAARYLVDAGGKRFRPLVSMLAAHFGDATRPEIVPSAVVCEITHLATLYHDDVMDEASVRRGAESANARWDNTVAILTGDFLFARASDILADLGPEAVRLQARTFARLGCEKELVRMDADQWSVAQAFNAEYAGYAMRWFDKVGDAGPRTETAEAVA